MQNIYDTYMENEILAADPVKLIQLLYRGALDAIGTARKHLAAGRIAERSQAISKALAIIYELSACLRHDQGGDLSHTLAALYDYCGRLLIDANFKQIEAPLIEVEQLIATLSQAWEQLQPAAQNPPQYQEPRNLETAYQSISYAY